MKSKCIWVTDLVLRIDSFQKYSHIHVYAGHERGEKGTCLLGPRSGRLADHLPNIGRQEGDRLLR